MNRKQLTLILVAFVVLGGLGLWLRNRDVASYKTTSGQMGQKVLGDFDVNAVARLVIKQGTNALDLAKKDDRWVVTERADYPANFTEVGEALRKLWDLKIAQSVPGPLAASALERLELNPDTTNHPATLVELQDKDGKVLRSLLLGKQSRSQPTAPSQFGGEEGFPDGRYVMVAGQAANGASLVSESFSSLEPKPESWLSKDFFKVEKVKSVAVTFPEATNSWKLARASETNEWVLADAKPDEKLDSSKISGIPTALSYPSFEDVVVNPNLAELGLDNPTVAELETTDGFTYTIKAGKKGTEDNYYLTVAVSADFPKERVAGNDEKPEDKAKLDKEFKEKTDKLEEKLKAEKALEGRVFKVSKWTLDSLLKHRGDLLKVEEKKDEKKDAAVPAPAPVNPVDATLPPVPPPAPEKKSE